MRSTERGWWLPFLLGIEAQKPISRLPPFLRSMLISPGLHSGFYQHAVRCVQNTAVTRRLFRMQSGIRWAEGCLELELESLQCSRIKPAILKAWNEDGTACIHHLLDPSPSILLRCPALTGSLILKCCSWHREKPNDFHRHTVVTGKAVRRKRLGCV